MKYDFDEPVRRRGTNCVKWDVCADGVLPLWVADMDFRAAPEIVDAVRRRAEEGMYGYPLPSSDWHESLVGWLGARHGWKVSPEWAVDSTGVLPALGAVTRACCRPGDKVVLQTPAYNGFFPVIRSQGCEIVESPLRRVEVRDGDCGDFTYEMDFEDLERKVCDPRVKIFLVSNPHNPAGRAWTAEELRRAGEICRRHGVLVASDEIHADLQMPGSRHVPFAMAGDWRPEEYVTFWSATKAFNIAGLHAAVALCPDRMLRERVRVAQDVGGSGYLNAFGFVASAAAWGHCADWLDELRAYLRGNYEVMLGFLRGCMPSVKVAVLEATYLAWLDVSALGMPSGELARRLEEEALVKFSPGSIYAEPDGGAFLRVNLASPRAMLMEALERAEGCMRRWNLLQS
jgi:cystathionine beta-lyase